MEAPGQMPRKTYQLGPLAGLRLTARPSVVLGSLLLWAALSGIGIGLLGLRPGTTIFAALIGTLLHWISDLIHQLGHAWAARRSGHPMIGIQFWGLLSSSIYPSDEPPLPARVHIRRALGGPLASLLLSAVAGAIALTPRPPGSVSYWLALFFLIENLFVFTLQALVPLGFNDGGTLWYWWRNRE